MSSIKLESNASGTGIFTIASPNSNTNRTLSIPDATTTIVGTDATQTLTNKTIQGGAITSATAQASTSGTSIDFTGIPSWVKQITVMFSGISTNGSSLIQIQIGDSGGIETSGYTGAAGWFGGTNTSASTAMSAGFLITAAGAAAFAGSGSALLTLLGSNNWVMQSTIGRYDSVFVHGAAGNKTLSDTLDRIRITTVNGTDTFDAGTINILYQG